jgi:GNAT superfamily N-acetyltransferase
MILLKEILQYLRRNEYENVYIIRGLVNKINGFRYEVEHKDNCHINGLAAFWEDDKAVTLRGDTIFCEKWFKQLWPEYNFYELNEMFINSRTIDLIEKFDRNSISNYMVMAYEPKELCVSNKLIEYIKIDKDEWNRISEIYKYSYNKNFTEFNPNSMEWICVCYEGKAIANLCLERVYGNLIVLSNFYVIPNMRCQGIGKKLLNRIFQDYANYRFVLFVSSENISAISLYKSIGFKINSNVINIEMHKSIL